MLVHRGRIAGTQDGSRHGSPTEEPHSKMTQTEEETEPAGARPEVIEREEIVVRFCGDSGDGMQVVGGQLTDTSAIFGNEVSTLPDFPAGRVTTGMPV